MMNDRALEGSIDAGRRGPDALANWRIACLLTLGAFLGLSAAAFAAGLLPGDLAVRHEFLEQANNLAAWPPRAVNNGGTWRVLLPAMVLLFTLSRAARRHWWLWCAIMIGSSLIEHTFKYLVGRPRPSGFALGFPSGHATAAATFAIVVVYIASRERLSPAARLTIQALAIAMMVLVGWARIVLHAHWPTDVLGGFLLGAGCAAAGAWWESGRPEPARAERDRAA
jgi:undecaprenyl-diphosphatase